MLIHLVKKDILISKKYAQLVILMAIGIPLFIGWRMPEFAQYTGFALAVVFSEFMFFQNLSMKENQYSKASALLCSTPYPSRGLVQSKYIVFILIFVYCVLIYWIESLFIPQVGSMNLTGVLAVFLGASVVDIFYVGHNGIPCLISCICKVRKSETGLLRHDPRAAAECTAVYGRSSRTFNFHEDLGSYIQA